MLPILINLGPIQIRSFGVFLVLAFLLGTFILWREGQKQGYNEEKLLDMAVVSIFSGFIGARVYYVLTNWVYYSGRLSDAFKFWEGGLAFHGALLGGGIGVWWFTRRNKWPFLQVADFASLAVLLGEIIGKIGSFLNGDDYGLPSKLPWAVQIPGVIGLRHPSPIYELIVLLIIYIFLLKKYRVKERSGGIFFSFLTSLGVGRLITEVFRDNPTFIVGLKEGFWGGGALVLLGALGLYWYYKPDVKSELRLLMSRLGGLEVVNTLKKRVAPLNQFLKERHAKDKN